MRNMNSAMVVLSFNIRTLKDEESLVKFDRAKNKVWIKVKKQKRPRLVPGPRKSLLNYVQDTSYSRMTR